MSAAFVAADAPSLVKCCWEPIGASNIGILNFSPKNSVEGSTDEVSIKTLGLNASLSKESRFLRIVVSDSAPPTK